jgi:DNA-binding transcriptional ArsR family regulator
LREEPELRRLLWFLLGGSRGGLNRARIINALRDMPRNQNQLADLLGLQYKAVQHHVHVLSGNSLIIGAGEKYGVTYSLSPWLESGIGTFDEICRKLGFELKGRSETESGRNL